MPDKQFSMTWVPDSYAARVQRGAVLFPAVGFVTSADQMRRKTLNLQKIWRGRLAGLADNDWVPVQGSQQYVRNCQPAFCYTQPQTRCCRVDYLCPFCYARWVRRCWETVDKAFPNPRGDSERRLSASSAERPSRDIPEAELPASDRASDGRPLRSIDLGGGGSPVRSFPYHLIERIQTVYAPFLPDREHSFTYDTYHRGLLEVAVEDRISRIRACNPRGALSVITAEPRKGGWRLRYRDLLQVPADYTLPESGELDEGKNIRVTRHPRPTRRVVFRCLIHVCRYPTMLLHGDTEMVAVHLRSRRRLRLTAMYGAFRKSSL